MQRRREGRRRRRLHPDKRNLCTCVLRKVRFAGGVGDPAGATCRPVPATFGIVDELRERVCRSVNTTSVERALREDMDEARYAGE